MTEDRLKEAETALGEYSCQCGSGGPMSCEDDCPGDTTATNIETVLRLLIDEMREVKQRFVRDRAAGTRIIPF